MRNKFRDAQRLVLSGNLYRKNDITHVGLAILFRFSSNLFFHRTRSSCCVVNASFLLHYERTFPRNVANIVSVETRKFRWLRRRSSFVKFVPKTSPLMLPLIWRSSKRTHSKRAQRPRNLGNGRRTGLLLASYVNRPYAESILLSTP